VPDSNLPFNDDSELAILIGATKKEIRAGLGAPEYCSESRHLEDDCPNSREWAYFFFHREPLTFGGGCCALELEFNARSKVKLVKWQAQR
jgi:hypothetical protein